MKKYLPLVVGASLALSACATIDPNLSPEQAYEKKVSNFKKLEWLIGTDAARRYIDDPRKPYVAVDNKKITLADQSRYQFDVRKYEYLGEETDGLIYAVIKDRATNSYKAGYLYPNGAVAIPFNFGHTNKDHLSSRAFFHGYAAVINHAADAQIYREEGAAHRPDQYAIIDKRGNFVVKYRAYVDIQKYPYDNYFTALYIDENG
ncbi:hypothetical protein [Moraxella canis]|uniref:Lipoprotein n=1 Tax=Moraxella canis TaxID=90239 RepID=A0A1S9ZQ24_9GAMM|nr:hypothetical protein [Moraxella canis]OOR85483.1 hypothetical protein B0180_01450 [Moraxella canis]